MNRIAQLAAVVSIGAALQACTSVSSVHFTDRSYPVDTTRLKPVTFRFDYGALKAAEIGQAVGGDKGGLAALVVAGIVASTGDPDAPIVINSSLSGELDWVAMMLEDCPSGRLTNVRSMVETREWPFYKQTWLDLHADCVLTPASHS
ncbi:hypothetical protein [Oceanobacter mangrovi]|uniref:hypothetical protein n=1 Tax=Oceanobacter mangrovi TaxID=2862510 RepID=UPI001C8DEA4E|nr:hypothetical protein [Oceanobacter mangrovi]